LLCSLKSLKSIDARESAHLLRVTGGDRNHGWRVARVPGVTICRETREEVQDGVLPNSTMYVARAADHRHLRDDALHPLIDRGDDQNVTAGVARPPDPDPLLVDLRKRSGKGNGVLVVTHLKDRIDLLARLAVARAKASVVVDENGEAVLDEHLGILVQEHLFETRKAVSHDDKGHWLLRAIGHIEPST
jgi:hypothetical protein